MERERDIGGWHIGTMNVKWEICKEINTYQMQLIDFAQACQDPSQSIAAAHRVIRGPDSRTRGSVSFGLGQNPGSSGFETLPR